MATRFHRLIIATASVRSTSSFSLKCFATSAKISSGTWVSDTIVSGRPWPGPLTIAEEWRFTPSVQGVQTLLGFTSRSRINRVLVQAKGAAVDLGSAHLDQG